MAPQTPSGTNTGAREASVLSVRDVTRRFGERVVLSHLDLEVAAGERIALRGANGVGKTTLLRCIAGTLAVSSGTIRVAGHPAGLLDARRLTGALLSQERSFYLRLSGRGNPLIFARLNGLGKRPAGHLVDELPFSVWVFGHALSHARRAGTLAQY